MANINIPHEIFSKSANKTVLITGAARGIGAETARLFHQNGANVVLTDLERCRSAADQFILSNLDPERAIFAAANVVDWAQLTTAFDHAIATFGGLDIVIANAGIMESNAVLDVNDVDEFGKLKENQEANTIFDVNLKGTLNTLRLALFWLQKSKSKNEGSKSIILIGSTSSYFGGTGVAAYVASKHGILGLLRAAQASSQELGVRVNAVAPFCTPTYITAGFAERWSEARLEQNTVEGVAAAIAFLALDEGRRGQCFLVSCARIFHGYLGIVPRFGGKLMNFYEKGRR
ncbi:hypothetical protein N7495_002735 [Penicillium taxi]|uniref:uncharacterized protein n=1 Tax=Penicillium taxi TaxID=168475 RepID=UPI0025453882|nr:uncharacterized protein N7495_002735 [Penicillium taxi]KAJ5902207.1 hypothetical protein N7495_002735 [Penicillium taxi]